MTSASDTGDSRDATGVWLHGVAVNVGSGLLAGVTGVVDGPVWTVEAAGLTAVVSAAPLAEFDEEALRRNLEDVDWLTRTAQAHHRVVAALSAAGPVVPARLATVYHDEDRVAAMLTQGRDEFAAALERVAGHVEWGVKGYAAPAAAPAPSPPAGSAGAGAAYLAKRRAQLAARDEDQRVAARDAVMVHGLLSERATAVRRHPPQDRRLSGAAAEMVLNGAYLVDANRVPEFTDLVEELSGRQLAVRLALTGPWPPYSFTDEAEADR